jgi:hypothetical protein
MPADTHIEAQVTGSATDVENSRARHRQHLAQFTAGMLPLQLINTGGKDMIGYVITWCDGIKHAPDIGSFLFLIATTDRFEP